MRDERNNLQATIPASWLPAFVADHPARDNQLLNSCAVIIWLNDGDYFCNCPLELDLS